MNAIALPNTPEWHALRRKGIGASEAAAACGLSRYETRLHVWDHKVNGTAKKETRAMRLGTAAEPMIRSEFELETALAVRPAPGLFRHPKIDWLLASPDGIVSSDTLAEFKKTDGRNADLGEPWTDELPVEWILQAQQQMVVLGAVEVLFGVLVDSADFRIYRVERDERVISGLIEREGELWDMIQRREAPPIDVDHASSWEAAQRAFRTVTEGAAVDLSPAAAEAWARIKAIREQKSSVRKLDAEENRMKAIIAKELREAEFGNLPGGGRIKRAIVTRESYRVEETSYVTFSEPKGN